MICFQEANHKTSGTKSWARYETYKGCTAQIAIESGCRRANLDFDWKHKYAEVFNSAILQRCVEPGPMVDDSQGLRYAEWDIAKLVLLPKKGDLVKAFDFVPREALFAVLRRFGLPDFVNIVIRLNENARIKVKVGDVESELESSIGVRQGSCEGPVLFLFIMQAAMETMKWPVPKPEFSARVN